MYKWYVTYKRQERKTCHPVILSDGGLAEYKRHLCDDPYSMTIITDLQDRERKSCCKLLHV